MSKSPITCHVLDSSIGKPVEGVQVELLLCTPDPNSATFQLMSQGTTNSDGRCMDLLSPGSSVQPGVYKMIFKTEPYFQQKDKATFYPWVEIPFKLTSPDEHYHIPLLISPFSFTTYRGS